LKRNKKLFYVVVVVERAKASAQIDIFLSINIWFEERENLSEKDIFFN
jgi:hypothetical protein